jgi:hypothetical protein
MIPKANAKAVAYSGLLTGCRQEEYHRGDAPRAR